jgi:hypothetical protein
VIGSIPCLSFIRKPPAAFRGTTAAARLPGAPGIPSLSAYVPYALVRVRVRGGYITHPVAAGGAEDATPGVQAASLLGLSTFLDATTCIRLPMHPVHTAMRFLQCH